MIRRLQRRRQQKNRMNWPRQWKKVLSDQTIVPQVVKFIRQYKTKQGINNALNKEFKDANVPARLFRYQTI